MDDVFTEELHREVDSIYPGASGRLDRIDELPGDAGRMIVNALLRQACESQHLGRILSARKALLALPRVWLSGVLPGAIGDVVALDDEWEYRRLIELLKDLDPPLFDSYIDYGMAAGEGEIYEIAADLKAARS
jgi:hypothetical protein